MHWSWPATEFCLIWTHRERWCLCRCTSGTPSVPEAAPGTCEIFDSQTANRNRDSFKWVWPLSATGDGSDRRSDPWSANANKPHCSFGTLSSSLWLTRAPWLTTRDNRSTLQQLKIAPICQKVCTANNSELVCTVFFFPTNAFENRRVSLICNDVEVETVLHKLTCKNSGWNIGRVKPQTRWNVQ